jgi:hypothetical protein
LTKKTQDEQPRTATKVHSGTAVAESAIKTMRILASEIGIPMKTTTSTR